MKPYPDKTIEEQPEPVLRRMLVLAEARGEPPEGQLAVMHVIKNRVGMFRTNNMSDVMLFNWKGTYHFTALDPRDANRNMMMAFHRTHPRAWAAVEAIASLFESGLTKDPTDGATHYYNPAVAEPNWGRNDSRWDEKAVIGRHVFGRAA